MKAFHALPILAALSLAATARAQGPDPATLAVSREVTLYQPPSASAATLATSREVTYYIPVGGLAATLAVSREVTAHFNFSLADAALVLRLAAGFASTPASTDRAFGILNLVTVGPSASVLDILDAAAVAEKAGHPEWAP